MKTLIERLRKKQMRVHDLSGVGYVDDPDCIEAAARIAALEAQLAEARGKFNDIACWSQSQGLLWWQVKARDILSALEATPPAPKVTEAMVDAFVERYELGCSHRYDRNSIRAALTAAQEAGKS